MSCFLTLMILLLTFSKSNSDEHIHGTKKGLDFYTNEVLNTNQTVPKNYTIIFYYVGSHDSPLIDFCKIDINAKSSAAINVAREMKTVIATIHISNATNVKASIALLGEAAKFHHSLEFVIIYHEHASKNSPSKSFTIIFEKNSTSLEGRKPFYRNSIGSRQSNDELLYFESRSVRNVTRFASRSFEYSANPASRITYVGFSFDVS